MIKPTTSAKTKRIDELERKLRETEAQLAHVYHFASLGIPGADRKRNLGSAVVVTMHYLGGKEVCPAFALKDGLSDETIAAILSDLKYSYQQTIKYVPRASDTSQASRQPLP